MNFFLLPLGRVGAKEMKSIESVPFQAQGLFFQSIMVWRIGANLAYYPSQGQRYENREIIKPLDILPMSALPGALKCIFLQL